MSDLWRLLQARAQQSPHALAAVEIGGPSVTFATLRDRAEAMAQHLLLEGVPAGTTVAWQLPSTVQALVVELALCRLGARQVPLIPQLRGHELRSIVAQARPRWLLTPGTWRGFDHAALAREVAAAAPMPLATLVVPELEGGDARELPPIPSPEHGESDRWIFFTSGTTSDPKGARHRDGALVATAAAVARRMAVVAEDRSSLTYPFAHVGGTIDLTISLLTGMANVLAPVFDRERTPHELGRLGVTLAGYAVPHWQAYLDVQRASEHPVLPAVREFPGGGAVKAAAVHDALVEAFGVGTLPSYGLTEAPQLTCAAPTLDDRARATTEGPAIDGTRLRIVLDDGTEAPADQEGEIRAKGPQVMLGYVNAELDADAFDEHGWLRTGDIGRLDADGNLVVTGRLKDVIIRNGENVSAREVEGLLAAVPEVHDVAVIGIPDPRTGERVCAVVVPGGPGLDEGILLAHLLRRGLMRQKLPEQFEFVRELPRNASGKVDRRRLTQIVQR